MVNIKRSWRGVSSAVGKIRRGLNKAQPYIRGVSTISGAVSDVAGSLGKDKVAGIAGQISSYTGTAADVIEDPEKFTMGLIDQASQKVDQVMDSLASGGAQPIQSNPTARPVTAGQCNRSINGSRCDNPRDHVHLGGNYGYGPQRPAPYGLRRPILRSGVLRKPRIELLAAGIE